MTSQHDVQTSSSVTTTVWTVDLEYTSLVFSTDLHDSIDLNCSIRMQSQVETEMWRDCPLLYIIILEVTYSKQSAAKWVIKIKVTITKMMSDVYNNNFFLDILLRIEWK